MKIRVINIVVELLVLYTPLSHAEIDISGYASFKAITNVNNQGVSYYNGLAAANETNYDSRESNLGIQFSTDISSSSGIFMLAMEYVASDSSFSLTI